MLTGLEWRGVCVCIDGRKEQLKEEEEAAVKGEEEKEEKGETKSNKHRNDFRTRRRGKKHTDTQAAWRRRND